MRNVFFTALVLAVASSAYAQEARPVLSAQYYQALGFKVAHADPWVFESRVLPGPGSKCTGSPNSFSVAFYYGGLRHLVTSDCNIPGVFASSNQHTYVDMDMDGKIDLVSIEYGDQTSRAVFYSAEFAPALNVDRRELYQREFEAIFKKLEAKMADI